MTTLRLLAPAKINLHLRVGPLRGDGFHSLLSWFVTVGLFDTLTLTLEQQKPTPMQAPPCGDSPSPRAEPGPVPLTGKEAKEAAPEFSAREAGVVAAGYASIGLPELGQTVELTCDPPGLPCDDRNLVVRAARAFAAAIREGSPTANAAGQSEQVINTSGLPGPGSCGSPTDQGAIVGAVSAALVKKIPVGAGLGGGSSDAARALLGLNALWRAGWPASDLSALAVRLGSDLPFFITGGGSAIVSGRGELTHPCPAPTVARWAVVMLSDVPMPTGPVYRRFDEMGLGAEENLGGAQLMKRWTTLSSEQLLPLLVNDLEPAAFSLEPRLAKLRNEANQLLGRVLRMSGSGSSLFTLYDDSASATIAAGQLSARLAVRTEVAEVSPAVTDDLGI